MTLFSKYLFSISLIFFTITQTNSSYASEKQEIDVLFLYSPQVSQHYGGAASTRINHIIESTNAIYASSDLDIQINAAEIQPYAIDDNIDPYTLMRNAKTSPDIQKLRDKFGADLVVLYGLYQSGKPCGLGYRPTSLNSKWIGISYVAINCAAYKTAHEIGHNMGLGHSYAQGSVPFLKYARGHGVKGKFATIMAYSSAYSAPKVYKFSSPNYSCKNLTCGVKEGAAQQADAVKALKQTAPIVANLQNPKAQEQCDQQQVKTFSAIKTSYQTQKIKLDGLSQQLTSLEALTNLSQKTYQSTLNAYKSMISNEFYPSQAEYQSARRLFVEQLSLYRQGEISREQIILIYIKYRDARSKLIALYEKVTQFHSSQYLPAYNKMRLDISKLATAKTHYQAEKNVLAKLQVDFDEANAIYTCV